MKSIPSFEYGEYGGAATAADTDTTPAPRAANSLRNMAPLTLRAEPLAPTVDEARASVNPRRLRGAVDRALG